MREASAAELAAIQDLLDKTFEAPHTCDHKGKVPVRLEVLRAEVNANAEIWSAYSTARAGIRRARSAEECALFKPKTLIDGNVLAGRLDSRSGEAFLFHGTSREAALNITRTDFRLSSAGSHRGTMFGPGIYLAENSSKADEYAEDNKTGKTMLLCRAALGKAGFEEHPGNYQHKVTSGVYDCVIGDREKAVGTYREIVLFNPDQVFPEYAVLYRRVMRDPEGP